MDALSAAIIGVLGTLAGTVLGWFLNSWAYRLGRTQIYATLVHTVEVPMAVPDGSTARRSSKPKREYSFRCVASNSRQIPVYLENFRVEVQSDRRSGIKRLFVYEPELSYAETRNVRIAARVALGRQIIPPRTLYEFAFSLGDCDPEIEYSKIVLVAYDERHKCRKFVIRDGRKLDRPPSSPDLEDSTVTPRPCSDSTSPGWC